MDSVKKAPFEESGTLSIFHQMTKLRAMGKDIINLCVGEPDIPPYHIIEEEAIRAIKSHKIMYTPSEGIQALREVVSGLLHSEGFHVSPDQNILITSGAKSALFLTFMALTEKNDEVIVPVPYYPSYIPLIRYAGAVPVLIKGNPQKGFKVSPSDIEPYLTSKSRFFLLNSPVNPTGSVYHPQELEELLSFLAQKNILCVNDDVYGHFIYDETLKSDIKACIHKYQESMILIRSFSKEYAMTGWRIGYLATPDRYISPLKILQGHILGNAQTASQYAALKALENPKRFCIPLDIFKSRREFVKNIFDHVKNVHYVEPMGAFYLFANIQKSCPGKSSEDVCQDLLEKVGVAVTPGKAFGLEGFIRISYADGTALKKGLERLVEGLTSR